MRKIIKAVSFCIIFCILFAVATVVLKEKWLFKSIYADAPATQFVEGFYAEPKNTMDVVYVGASTMFMSVNPLEIWKNEGITGYVFGSGQQKAWNTNYYVKELVKYQKPKVIVIEMLEMFETKTNDESHLINLEPHSRVALDYMRLSRDKLQAINNTRFKSETVRSYIFPFIRYHTRWGKLEKQDFEFINEDKSYFLKGFVPQYRTQPQDFSFENMSFKEMLPSDVSEYLDEIVEICRKENIELLFIKSPTGWWNSATSDAIKEYADSKGIEFLDYNKFYKSIGISQQTDFWDSVHINFLGAEKLSAHLGKYIKENYFPKGYENEKADKQEWNLCYEKYQELKIANELSTETDPTQYIKKLQNPDYIISIATKGVMNNDDKALGDKLAQLGLEQITNRSENENYVAVIDKGKTVFEKTGNERIEYFNKNIDDMPYLIKCLPTGEGKGASILVDKKEVCQNQRGINLVVYDTKLDMVVDSCCFADENTIIREQ